MDSHRRNQDVSEYSYQKNRSKLSNSNCFCSGIINLLFDGLAYNTADILLIARIFPRPCGARKNTMQLAKYPHVLYAKPSNKVYVYSNRNLTKKPFNIQHYYYFVNFRNID